MVDDEATEVEQHKVKLKGFVHFRWKFHARGLEHLRDLVEKTYFELVGGEEAAKGTALNFEVSMDPFVMRGDGTVAWWECNVAGNVNLEPMKVAPPAEDQNATKPYPNREQRRKQAKKR